MKLLEMFLVETTEEDRAIISLASALWHEALKYKKKEVEPEPYYNDDFDDDGESIPDIEDPEEDETISLGKIGNLVDTPLQKLKNVKIDLQSDYGMRKEIKKAHNLDKIREKGAYYGLWDPESKTITLNRDLIDEPAVRSAVAHELRHALDDYKSNFKASSSTRYSTPKDKSFRGVEKDPIYGDADYFARPEEINARFIEVLNSMVPKIRSAVKEVPPEQLRSYILAEFRDALDFHHILKYFPQGAKSPDYKRLMKRGVDFIQKEIQHQLQVKK